MADRLAELGALQYAVENLSTAGTNPNRLGLAGYIHAAYTDYQAWAAANPGVNPNRLSARGRIYGYFYDHASWSPLSLFASSEVGAWYDPSDLTTMFQDRAGTAPVTADGQTVGLILDKSKGLVIGSELVTNGGFDTDTVWTKGSGVTISGGTANFSASSGYVLYKTSNAGIFSGGYYEVTFTVSNYVSGTVGPYLGATAAFGTEVSANGTYTQRFGPVAGSEVGFRSSSAFTGSLDNFSVKAITGNHAVAPSDAARPLKTSTGLSKWINYDAVDDVLNTTFTSSLGSSCTVCRANVGAAPTILTAQTIGTSYADSTDHAGLIIINRALTGQETTDVTAWLTAKGATA